MFYGLLFAIIAMVCWGNSPVLMRWVVDVDPISMSFARACGAFVGSVILALWGVCSAFYGVESNIVFAFVVIGLCSNLIGDMLLFLAVKKTGVALASAISSTYPVVVAFSSVAIFGEKITLPIMAGTALIVLGTVLLSHKKTSGQARKFSAVGIIYAVLASIFWGVAVLEIRYISSFGYNGVQVAFGRGLSYSIFAAITWFGMMSFSGAQKKRAVLRSIFRKKVLLVPLTGFLSITIGSGFYAQSLKYLPVTIVTPIAAAAPFYATLAAHIIFKEELRVIQYAGLVMIVVGTVTVAL